MPHSTADGAITVALLGNPNTGKSTLFSALAGVRQRVGNYPGVTVEKKVGRVEFHGRHFELIDLPGTYSLAPRSLDEMVAVDVLLGRRGDVRPPSLVLCIVDASNLERNLYLVSQILELKLPVVLALNMTDVAADRGIRLDIERMRRQLGVPIVEVQAHRRIGLEELKEQLAAAAEHKSPPPATSPFPAAFRQEVASLEAALQAGPGGGLPRYLVERLLLDTGGYLAEASLPGVDDEFREQVAAARERLKQAGLPVPAVEAMARYGWVGEVLQGVVSQPSQRPVTWTDRLDRVLTHRFIGTAFFILLMVLVFQSIFSWSGPAMDAIEAAIGWLGDAVESRLPPGSFRSLLVDGVIAGVGGVFVFLPQILILFLFIAILEDCGYMARAAYLMDKLMSRIGLSGKSFIPLLSSFACAVPGIMAARVIENRRDRLVTILIAPLMSCSARLPVYTLLIAAFVPEHRYLGGFLGLQGITMFAMYGVGVVTAVAVAWLLKKTILKSEQPPFVMELPSYKIPSLQTVLWRMIDRAWSFVRRAGTLILAVTILVWAAAYFPHDPQVGREVEEQYTARIRDLDKQIAAATGTLQAEQTAELSERRSQLETEMANAVAGAYIEQSILGRMGKAIEPVVRPLGWDWRIGCAVIASFPAREVVIGTLGVIYGLGGEQDEASDSLRDSLKASTWPDTQQPVFNLPVALSIMVFFALCAQCAATLAVIRRETNSWRWPIFTFVYMTTLAYLGAWLTYHVGRWF